MTDYMLGLQRLEEWFRVKDSKLPSEELMVFTNLKTALIESLDDERRLAGLIGPVERTERRRILDQLNRLALEHCGVAFIDFCNPSSKFAINTKSTSQGQQIVIVLGDFIKSMNVLSGQFSGPTTVEGGRSCRSTPRTRPI